MQSRVDSFMEAVTNTAIGLGIAITMNATVTPWILHRPVSLVENSVLSAIFTIVSIIRSYTLRRLFNGRTVWQAIKDRYANTQRPVRR